MLIAPDGRNNMAFTLYAARTERLDEIARTIREGVAAGDNVHLDTTGMTQDEIEYVIREVNK